jgi:hypothetical protein
MNLNDLKKEIPYKYKPQSIKNGKATMVSYIDARDVQDLLDDVVGPENWQTDYKVINENMFCGIGIKTPDGWVWKFDCGVESNVEQEKGEASDAFKRAAVQWGIGRFLYRLGIVELKTAMYKDKEKPATDEGKILWNNDEISAYIRSRAAGKQPINHKPASDPKKYEKPATEPTYTNPFKEETMKKVSGLVKGELKGKECIKAYLEDFNKAKNTTYKLPDLNTDEKINAIIDFINNIPPKV